MNKTSDQALAQQLDILTKMPAPAFPADKLDVLTLVCVCGKRMPIANQKVINTGVIVVPDNLCPDCHKEIGDFGHLVCHTCRRVVTSIVPHKDPDGFMVERGRFYHTVDCPVCNESLRTKESKVAIWEKYMYQGRHNELRKILLAAGIMKHPSNNISNTWKKH